MPFKKFLNAFLNKRGGLVCSGIVAYFGPDYSTKLIFIASGCYMLFNATAGTVVACFVSAQR